MNSIILRTSSRLVLPAAIIFSLYVLLRGHNEPGGGFVGGLIAAAGLTVHALPRGRDALLATLRMSPKTLIGIGLTLALLSGVPALLLSTPYLTHQWWAPAWGLGTTLIFDVGVYLTVVGSILTFFSYYSEG